ncbi:microtubule-associated protein 70-2-like [Nicotiana tabacum]|uniref:Microtubule-associated protein 70-2-like n=1 Tax=Nicotiana tabacum TaxID=4097 RepID=A0AC58UKZ6_TOBAC
MTYSLNLIKEAALLEAQGLLLVDDLQNKNQARGQYNAQTSSCKIEKLTKPVDEREKALLAGGAAPNAVQEYLRKFKNRIDVAYQV